MMSATMDSEDDGTSLSQEDTDKSTSVCSIDSIPAEVSTPVSLTVEPLQRKLGSNELFAFNCHNSGNLNIMCGITLLTRHSIDEGLMKCSLQEFQHMFPQLTSRIKSCSNNAANSNNNVQSGDVNSNKQLVTNDLQELQFIPMECPTLPLDTSFECKNMLHEEFSQENGPLWRIQLIDESTMDSANLKFGPELCAILEDQASDSSTRWRYFLRYHQGSVNQANLANYDQDEEGHRSFLLMTFHPSITDIHGCFHLMKHFISILETKLEAPESLQIETNLSKIIPLPHEEQQTHLPIESLLPKAGESSYLKELFPMAKSFVNDFVLPHKSPMVKFQRDNAKLPNNLTDVSRESSVLRGWLNTEQTDSLLALLEEDDCNLQSVLLAAGLLALARAIDFQKEQEEVKTKCQQQYPNATISYSSLNDMINPNIRAANAINLRNYCTTYVPRHGNLTTRYETDHEMPPNIDDRADFWRYAHELTVKSNYVKGKQTPFQMMKQYNNRVTTALGNTNKIRNELDVSYFGDLDRLFGKHRNNPLSQHISMVKDNKKANKEGILCTSKPNVTLEDVFYCQAAPSMGTPFTHSAHIFNGRLNYILSYHTPYIKDQRMAFMIRDEVINILRMAVE